jgi:hypothetical protein
MTDDATAFRRRMTLAATIRQELLEVLPDAAARASWLRLLAQQYERERGQTPERFTIAPESPEAAFLP